MEMLQLYHQAGKHTQMAHTSIWAVFMPTMDKIYRLKRLPHVVTMRDAETLADGELVCFKFLFDNQCEFKKTHQDFSPEDALDVTGSFNQVQVTPLATKVSKTVFLCTCADANQ